MEVNAVWLNKNNYIRKQLEEESIKLLKIIQSYIINASRSGENYIFYPLQSLFPLIPIDVESARLYVFSKIISEIKNKGFKIKLIKKNEHKYELIIIWDFHFSIEEINNMKHIVSNVMQ